MKNNKEPKFVSKKEMSDFLDKFPQWQEFYTSNGNEIFQVKYNLDLFDEITDYWIEKGFYYFKNLTITFEGS